MVLSQALLPVGNGLINWSCIEVEVRRNTFQRVWGLLSSGKNPDLSRHVFSVLKHCMWLHLVFGLWHEIIIITPLWRTRKLRLEELAPTYRVCVQSGRKPTHTFCPSPPHLQGYNVNLSPQAQLFKLGSPPWVVLSDSFAIIASKPDPGVIFWATKLTLGLDKIWYFHEKQQVRI